MDTSLALINSPVWVALSRVVSIKNKFFFKKYKTCREKLSVEKKIKIKKTKKTLKMRKDWRK